MTDEILNHLSANGILRKRKIVVNNFLGGLAWGVGSVLGATVAVALLVSLLRFANVIPGISEITNQVTNSVDQKIPNY